MDSKTLSLDEISKQARTCQKFYTGNISHCSDCPHGKEYGFLDCVGGFTPRTIAVLIRLSEELDAAREGKTVDPAVFEKYNSPWIKDSFQSFPTLDRICTQAKVCAKIKEAGVCGGCPLNTDLRCIGTSFAREPIRIIARYAEKIEKEKQNKNKGKED